MDEQAAEQVASATIEATVIRADGTVEELGVISSTDEGTVTWQP